MSYCRWSSNNWDCDLYCYADVSGGYTTLVAANRVVGAVPKLPEITKDMGDGESILRTAKWMTWLKTAKHQRIGLPQDGKSFNDATLAEFRDRVVWLKDMGYHVPQSVIDRITAEMAEEARQ